MQKSMVSNRVGKRTITIFRIIFPLCLLGTLIFIFGNSSDIGSISGGKSAEVMTIMNKIMEWLGFGYRFSERIVRKLAHFTEYAIMGLWLMLSLRVYTRRIISFISWPLFLGLFTAVIDEFYQLFIPGRTGQVMDVTIDFMGVISGLVIGLFTILLTRAILDALKGKR